MRRPQVLLRVTDNRHCVAIPEPLSSAAYHPRLMAKRAFWAVPLAALVGSQAGHLVSYGLRFGSASLQLQGTGAHAYFPAVAKTGLGFAATAVVMAMLAIGAARLVGHRRIDTQTMPSLLRLLAVLFTLQVACFVAQETAEAMLGGGRFASAPSLLLWGAAGQLPVALVLAVALRWLGARFAPALATLRLRVAHPAKPPPPALTLRAFYPPAATLPALATVAAGVTRRGPPVSS